MGKNASNFDGITALLLLCLGSFGLFLLLTLGKEYFFQQFLYMVVGGVILVIFSRLDATLLWWFAPIGYVLGTVFLALSYLGPSIRGATRWLIIGTAQLQPSELAKPLFLLGFAYFLQRYSARSVRNVFLHVILITIPFLLVFKQPDLGSSLVYVGFWVCMLLAGGLSVRILIASVLGGVFLLPLSWSVLAGYQKSRILTFLNPSLDPQGAGYNALQAMIAVGSGQWFGRGLGRGTQSHLRFLPEYHTDFIFATLIEELGFIGGIILLTLYVLLLTRIVSSLLREYKEEAGIFIYSIGLFAMLLSQVVINTGMNMGLIPITGITLPLVSYGGSSILSTAMSFGILWALQKGRVNRSAIAIR